MKFKFAVAALLAVAASSLHAQTEAVYLTGSTAYRSAVIAELTNLFGAPVASSGSNQGVWVGTDPVTTAPINVFTSFTGSEGGIQTTDQNGTGLAISFLSYNGSPATHIPDGTFSDTFQASSAFNGTFQGKTYPALTAANTGVPTATGPAGTIGLVPFNFVLSPFNPADTTGQTNGTTGAYINGWNALNNITAQQARVLFTSGTLPMSFFTGSTLDANTTVYAFGRDPDSGTRLTALAETGIGIGFQTVKQYAPYSAAANTIANVINSFPATVDHVAPYPSGTVNGVFYNTGNNSYNSGGNLSKALSNTFPLVSGNPAYAIAYLGTSDAATTLGNGGKLLTYNGNAYTNANIGIGNYTFWGYEHAYYRPATAGTAQGNFIDYLSAGVASSTAILPYGPSIVVKRATDGSNVVHQ